MAIVDNGQKRDVADDAALVSIKWVLPFNFAQREGMNESQQACVKVGRSFPMNANINFDRIYPSPDAVRDATVRLAAEKRSEFRNRIKKVMEIGGGVTSDGLAQKATDNHYYYLIVHYMHFEKKDFELPTVSLKS